MVMDTPYFRKELRGLTGRIRFRSQRLTGRLILQMEEEWEHFRLMGCTETSIGVSQRWRDARVTDIDGNFLGVVQEAKVNDVGAAR